MAELIERVNGTVNNVVWGIPMLILLVGTGIFMTLRTKGFQLLHMGFWLKRTIGSIFTDKNITKHVEEEKTISQFQSMCAALAATLGTGNIVGVATALLAGGPGAVFWMWIVAFFGMMTSFSENVLGIYFRRKNAIGEWCGGPMYYLRDGLSWKKGGKPLGSLLATLFSLFCILASFGMGNMSQVNSIAANLKSAFHIPEFLTGIFFMLLVGMVIFGGIKRIASVTEIVVPFMAVFYLVGALILVIVNIENLGKAFTAIFQGAFHLKAVGGGAVGVGMKQAITWGMKRGVFSNEAGLGSAVMVHANSNVKEPVRQGMWGIFEVFADTIVVCTLTALAVLTSGVIDLNTGEVLTDAGEGAIVGEAFSTVFGSFGPAFIAIAILLFAFATVLGWSYFGTKAFEYLFGTSKTVIYQVLFIACIFFGATMSLDLAWDLSDTFNGLMAIPNLIGVLVLSPVVVKITKNYVDRKIKGKRIRPMLSVFLDIQEELEKDLTDSD